MTKAIVSLTFPDCVNRGEGPCEAWRGMAEQFRLGSSQYDELQRQMVAARNAIRRLLGGHAWPGVNDHEPGCQCPYHEAAAIIGNELKLEPRYSEESSK